MDKDLKLLRKASSNIAKAIGIMNVKGESNKTIPLEEDLKRINNTIDRLEIYYSSKKHSKYLYKKGYYQTDVNKKE